MVDKKEEILIRKLIEGDEFAYQVIYNTYYTRLYNFALYYLNDEEKAKDVVHDVMAFLWEQCDKLAGIKSFSSWLFSVTKNQCLKKIDSLKVREKHRDYLKYRQLKIMQSALNELDTSPIAFDEINRIIEQTLKALSPRCRHVFELSRYENKKNREIAEELNISEKAVEAHITRSIKTFKKALKDYLPFVLFLLG